MKIISITLLILLILSISISHASEVSIKGTIQSYGCITKKYPCPKDKDDPLTSYVKTYVLINETNRYYFVPNLDQNFLSKFINKRIRITGKLIYNDSAIEVRKLEIFKENTWITEWLLGGKTCVIEDKLDIPD
jgi:hypothetical protein